MLRGTNRMLGIKVWLTMLKVCALPTIVLLQHLTPSRFLQSILQIVRRQSQGSVLEYRENPNSLQNAIWYWRSFLAIWSQCWLNPFAWNCVPPKGVTWNSSFFWIVFLLGKYGHGDVISSMEWYPYGTLIWLTFRYAHLGWGVISPGLLRATAWAPSPSILLLARGLALEIMSHKTHCFSNSALNLWTTTSVQYFYPNKNTPI